MVAAFRLVRIERSEDAFSGEGARIAGGRWNSPGQLAVYTAASLALAALENLVHSLPRRDRHFVSFELAIPPRLITDPGKLPPDWSQNPPPLFAAALGDAWLDSRKSAALRVPSSIVPSESNFILNPQHPDFAAITIGPATPFTFDQRLLT